MSRYSARVKTEILKINPFNIDIEKIKKAANVIIKGGLVVFPTETVYALGGDALNPKACAKIFEVKKRPLNKPLIILIAKKKDIYNLSLDIPKIALKLIQKFWPGPLTLVLKKSELVPDVVTANLTTVGIRMPGSKIALSLIREVGKPVASSSANLSGFISPVNAQDVLDNLCGKIDMIIDGGDTEIGIESTILDLTCHPFYMLRQGAISIEELKSIVKRVEIIRKINEKKTKRFN